MIVPVDYVADDVVKIAGKAIDCIKEVSMCEKREQTARYEIQKQFEVYIKAIEASTEKFKTNAAYTHEHIMKVLDMVDKLISRENLNDSAIAMVNSLLSVVDNSRRDMYSLASQNPSMMLK